MNRLLHHWRVIVQSFLALLLLGFLGWGCVSFFSGLDKLMSDKSQFDYDHNLPRAYNSHTTRNLKILQVALQEYAQSHQGFLPPMQDPAATLNALRPRLQSRAKWCYYNPATRIPFTPNAALADKKIGALGRNALAFYDADPPAGYRESYYVTVSGTVGHVPLAQLPGLLHSTTVLPKQSVNPLTKRYNLAQETQP